MRKISIALLICITLLSSINLSAQKFDVMSFNIRLDIASDGINAWENRKKEMAEMLNYYNPEILGMQEVLPNQLKYLNDELKDHAYIGVGRDDGKQKGEFAPIFYDTSKFTLIEHSSFWLSETSEKPTMGWDAAYMRVCTYGLFQYKDTEHRIWVFNTHFDNKGEKAREMSAKLVLDKIAKLNTDNSPVVFMGDLNCIPSSKPVKLLSEELNYAVEKSDDGLYGPAGTFNGFNNVEVVKERIDYIFEKKLKVQSYAHLDDRLKNNNCVSDHYPVLMKAKFSDKKSKKD
jgi:endonuclease/exonuclease/phosphatase family metal-dependent hydrolase